MKSSRLRQLVRVGARAPAAIGSGRLAAWEISRFDLLSLSSGRLGSGFQGGGVTSAGAVVGREGGGGGHGGCKGPPGVTGEGVRGLAGAIARRDRDR